MEMSTETLLNRKRERGTIVFLHSTKYFGFIRTDEDDKEMFFHAKGLLHYLFDDLKEGSRVEYNVVTVRDKEKAIAIEVIE